MDFTRATEVTEEVRVAVEDAFAYHLWNDNQRERGERVRKVLAESVLQLICDVPPGPDRTHAIRLIRDARMWANSGITNGGRY